MKNPRCFQCGKADVVESVEDVEYDFDGIPVLLVATKVSRCPECGEKEVAIVAMEKLIRQLVRHIAHKTERLLPAELRFLRTSMGLSSKDLAAQMSVDKSTVSRWEHGEQAVGERAEKLLRLMALSEKPVKSYGLEKMAVEKPMRKRLTLNHNKKGWEIRAA